MMRGRMATRIRPPSGEQEPGRLHRSALKLTAFSGAAFRSPGAAASITLWVRSIATPKSDHARRVPTGRRSADQMLQNALVSRLGGCRYRTAMVLRSSALSIPAWWRRGSRRLGEEWVSLPPPLSAFAFFAGCARRRTAHITSAPRGTHLGSGRWISSSIKGPPSR
jgi:hypothetical protein